MANVVVLKMFFDVGFVLTVVYICLRSLRQSREVVTSAPAVNVKEIEKSVKSVIVEAEDASRELTRELNKRQRNLEQILFDLGTVETKIARASDHADERIEELQRLLTAPSQTTSKEINPSRESTVVETSYDTGPIQSTRKEIVISLSDSIETVEEDTLDESTPLDSSKYNIFGELLAASDEEESPSPLASRIEIEREDKRQPMPPRKRPNEDNRGKIEQIYSKAKELLSAGESIATIAAETKLSKPMIERIRSTMIVDEQIIPQPPPSKDSRLGVLGSMRRSIETL